jgi:chromosome segregation protein
MINRLISLDLQGFKTFATNTRFEFPGRITTIVGPNGSGKSNIADSIRWVLGEQSYSLLRAKRTDDMIFSGSQQRPRAGMASASITFDNADAWLPIDFSEVSITRRAYRDGQNDYLLNGQKVRLKDITELLSQTGLSEMTYTVIGQGLVDVALALKPDERRKLFEEAAGIGLYRARKEEALRRLDNTRKNLDRVLDIMTEIKPRLRSLERQATRFIEYERLRADLQVQLREWYGYHWHQKQADVRNVRNAFLDQETRLVNLRQKHAEIEEKVSEQHQILQTRRQALEKAHHQLSEEHQQLEQANRDLAILEERRRSYQQQKNNLEIDLAHVQEEIEELSAQEAHFEQELSSLKGEYDTALEEKTVVEEKLHDVETKRNSAQHTLDALHQQRLKVETDHIQVTAHCQELQSRLENAKEEKQKIQDALTAYREEQDTLKEQIKIVQGRLDGSDDMLSSIKQQVEEKAEQIDVIRREKLGVAEELSALDARLAKKQAQLDVLEQAEAALSGYSEGSKNLVEKSRQGILPGGIEPLSKHLLVESAFEKAIGAALGELADLLVIPRGEAEMVISFLESNGTHRVALVPMEISSGPKEEITSPIGADQGGIVGRANQLISCDPAYQGIIDHLFSNILIVEDRRTAVRLQSKLSKGQQIVTLNGMVFHPTGLLISGQNASGRRIGRTREKSDLQSALSALQEKKESLQQQLIRMAQTLFDLEEDADILKDKVKAEESTRQTYQGSLQKYREDHTRLKEQIRWHQERLDVTREQIANTRISIAEQNHRTEEISAEIASLEVDEEQTAAALKKLPLFELQQERNHWQTHFIVAESALNNARQRYEAHQKQIQQAQSRMGTYRHRLDELQSALHDSNEKKASLEETIQALTLSIGDIEDNRISPLKNGLREVEKTYGAIQRMEEHTHQQIVIAERQHTQLQMELSRRNDQLKNLQQRIEDDFGLVSFDYDQKMDGPTPLPFDDDLIESLPRVQKIPENLGDDIKRLKTQIRRIGAVNPEAQSEYESVRARHTFMKDQIRDLEKASQDLCEVIEALDVLMERDFMKTFKAVNAEFSKYFARLFNGGEADLSFSDNENPVEGGVDIEARLPGRRRQALALLSGGERSLTAVALIFALLKISPTPFCVLDEVDAMLDESNVGRFVDLLKELSSKTQFILITHNRNTVQAADVIYGITMSRDSTSQVISLKLEDVDETYLE